jgi:hypothetical protein
MRFGRSRAFWSSAHGPRLSNCEDIARGNGSIAEDGRLGWTFVHRRLWNIDTGYRIRGAQSFGDKWAVRRIMSAPCRKGVRSSNEKSLPLLSLIAHKLTRRICGFGQGGEGEELGSNLLPVPGRSPGQSNESSATSGPGYPKLSPGTFPDPRAGGRWSVVPPGGYTKRTPIRAARSSRHRFRHSENEIPLPTNWGRGRILFLAAG